MREMKIGVIGLGNRGLVSVLAHQPARNCRIIAGADINAAFFSPFQEKIGDNIFFSDNYKDIVHHQELNTIIICSPDYLHEEHALEALESGKDIFLEKPMAISTESCDRILETGYRRGRKIYVGHNLRYMNFTGEMKKIIDTGMIGQPMAIWVRHFVSRGGDCYFKDWHADRRKSGSLLIHKGVHDIDIVHWLGGAETETAVGLGSLSVYNRIKDIDYEPVSGKRDESMENWPPLTLKGMNPVIDVEDHSIMTMRLRNGTIASYMECHYTPDYWRNYTVIGTEGRLENFGSRVKGTQIKVYNQRMIYDFQGNQTIQVPEEITEESSPDFRMMKDFLDYLQLDKKPQATALDARNAAAAAEAATKSIRNNGIPFQVQPVSRDIVDFYKCYNANY